MAVIDFTTVGARFGLLTVSGAPFKKEGRQQHYYVPCKCDCGGQKVVQCYSLTKGFTISCGCEHRRMMIRRNTVHGQHGTPTYISWQRMLARCVNPNEPRYEDYGGRGITVCERWLHSFENFLADMGDRPDGTTLDRHPDTNGNYEPNNCRWANYTEQANNKRNNVVIEYAGKRLTIAQWSRETGISLATIRERTLRGWSAEKALTTPVRITSRK